MKKSGLEGNINDHGNTIDCRYNAVQFITILHPMLQWQQQNTNQIPNSQQTPHYSPSRASYGVSVMKLLNKLTAL